MTTDITTPVAGHATAAAVQLDSIRLGEWIEGAGLPRSTAYRLVEASGITPEQRRIPGKAAKVSFLSREQFQLLDELLLRYHRDGLSMRDISALAPQLAASAGIVQDRLNDAGTVQDSLNGPGTVQDSLTVSGTVQDSLNRPWSISTLEESMPLLRTLIGQAAEDLVPLLRIALGGVVEDVIPLVRESMGEVSDQLMQLLQGLINQAESAQSVHPLEMARRLREAADLAVPLSQSEVGQLLGLSTSTIEKWRNDQELRPGYMLQRQVSGNRVWWTVVRPQADVVQTVQDNLTVSETVLDRPNPPEMVGFGRFIETTTAAVWGRVDVQVSGAPVKTSPALPYWS